MPRNGKGQSANPQRTDLNTAVPKQSVGSEGREFGARKQDMDAQEQIPLRPPPGPPARVPGDRGPLNRPTDRPDQPITSGIDLGPGRGPEALRLGNEAVARRKKQQQYQRIHDLAQRTGDPFLNNILRKVSR